MKAFNFAAVILAFLSSISLAQTQPAAQPDETKIPIRKVVLFSSGVGYFEHFGTVTGDNRTELHFKTQQINDILKSLVLQDLDGGQITTIIYPSQDPLAKTLKSFQVDITNNPSLADLLNQLRGAKVTIEQGNQKTTGTILGVEKQTRPVGDKDQTVEERILNLLAGMRLLAINLESVSSLSFDDPELQNELTGALAALAQARDQDKKPVWISFEGKGERRVRIAYVVETPVWKTSYRLLLSKDQKPRLQGWAIVENQTDNDWNDIHLSLVSGRPISFVEDLYQPLYAPRPMVKRELFAGLMPVRYEEGLAQNRLEAARFGVTASAAPEAARRPTVLYSAGQANSTQFAHQIKQADWSSSIASIASAASVGELFHYTVAHVTLPRQKSAMIPIVTDDIEIEKVSIYNTSILPKNPLNGARLKNTTGKHLLAGPITVFEDSSYAGDAQINTLPPGQERLISYGIDQQVTVDATKNKQESSLVAGEIVKGVLWVQHKQVSTQDYVVDNKSDVEKTLIIEHPRRDDWALVDTEKPAETSDSVYRFRGKIPAHNSSKLTVKEQHIQSEALDLLPTAIDRLLVYAKAGEIPDAVKKALSEVIAMRQVLADTQAQLSSQKTHLKELNDQQSHTSQILKPLQPNSSLYTRLSGKLNDLQDGIDKAQAQIEELTKAAQEQQQKLDDKLANLTVG